MKLLGQLSRVYAVIMVVVATSLLVMENDPDMYTVFYCVVLALHALAQWIYATYCLGLLGLPVYEENGMLDNQFAFGSGEEQITGPAGGMVLLAIVATFVALIVGFMGVSSINDVLGFRYESPRDLVWFVFYLTGVLLFVPVVLFNLRTWNMRRLQPLDDARNRV